MYQPQKIGLELCKKQLLICKRYTKRKPPRNTKDKKIGNCKIKKK